MSERAVVVLEEMLDLLEGLRHTKERYGVTTGEYVDVLVNASTRLANLDEELNQLTKKRDEAKTALEEGQAAVAGVVARRRTIETEAQAEAERRAAKVEAECQAKLSAANNQASEIIAEAEDRARKINSRVAELRKAVA